MSSSSDRQKFEAAFAKRLGKTPPEFVQQKLHSGSKVEDIRYQYEIITWVHHRRVILRPENVWIILLPKFVLDNWGIAILRERHLF